MMKSRTRIQLTVAAVALLLAVVGGWIAWSAASNRAAERDERYRNIILSVDMKERDIKGAIDELSSHGIPVSSVRTDGFSVYAGVLYSREEHYVIRGDELIRVTR